MPKQGFTTCPECGCEVSKGKLARHIRKAHPKKTTQHGVIEPKGRKAKTLSPRKQILLEFQKEKETRKNVAIVIAVVVIIVLAGAIYYYKDSLIPKEKNPTVVMETSKGTIKFVLYKDKVPNTAKNFERYVEANFYEGLIFHRVANLDASRPNTHIVQGGGFEPGMKQKAALYSPIELEIDNGLTHVDGAVAMARTDDINSATSQFYFCDGEQHFLDDAERQSNDQGRGYAVFGKVTSGMDVVRAIAKVPVQDDGGYQNVPVDPITIENVYIE